MRCANFPGCRHFLWGCRFYNQDAIFFSLTLWRSNRRKAAQGCKVFEKMVGNVIRAPLFMHCKKKRRKNWNIIFLRPCESLMKNPI